MPPSRIEMLNLRRHQASLQPGLGEVLLAAVEEARYVRNEPVTPFEAALARACGRPYAVGVGSGTAALHLALVCAGIGAGDEVITVPNSFFATTEAILHAGARPVFVDVDPRTHLMDLDALTRLVTPKTGAVLVVHLYGNVVDVAGVRARLADLGREDVVVVEDCAHAMGARRDGRPVPLGDLGAFSFNPTKNLSALGDAGAVVTERADWAERVRLLRDHGRREKNVHVLAGYNSRLSGVNDAVLAMKLVHLDGWNDRRRRIAAVYDGVLNDGRQLERAAPAPGVLHAYHQYVVCAPSRDAFRAHLERHGIATAVHYPRLIPDQPPLRALGHSSASVPAAARLCREVVSLPCYPELEEADVQRIAAAVSTFVSPEQDALLAEG